MFLGGFGFSQDANAIPVFSFEFGSGGSDPGQFTNPQSATTDSNDRIIVADTNNHRIQVFDSTGVFQQSITDADGVGGTFQSPVGVAVDSSDRIIVVDRANDRIQIFDGAVATTPEEQTTSTINEIENILDDPINQEVAEKAQGASNSLQIALDELNKDDIQAAAGNIEGAIGDIEAAINEGLDAIVGAQLMDDLAGIAKQLAEDAIAQAVDNSGDPDKIEEAEASLAEGDALRVPGTYKDAANKYKDALAQAEGALP